MSGWRAACAYILLLFSFPTAAADAPTFTFDGVVVADRGRVQGLIPTVAEAYALWLAAPGEPVAMGDAIIIWDTHTRQLEAARLETALEAAHLRQRRREQQLQAQIDDLVAERAALQAELAVVEARIASLRQGERERVQLLRQQLRAAELDQAEAELAQQALERRYELGEIAEAELRRGRLRQQAVAAAVQAAAATLQRAEKERDDIAIARERLRAAELRRRIGIDDDGAERDQGLNKQLSATRKRRQREAMKAAADAERAVEEWQTAVREAWDHTPLRRLELRRDDADGELLHDIFFQPASAAPPASGRVDSGAVFDPARGYGWQRDRTAELRWRANEAQGSLVLRGPARWRLQLADGDYHLRLTLGDTVPWQGALVRVQGEPLASIAELPAGDRLLSTVCTVDDGTLVLDCNDTHGKAMRAPDDGLAKVQPWVGLGWRSWKGGWPFAYFTPAAALQVQAVVHQDLAPLLAPDPAAAAADPRRRLATDQVELHSASGWTGTGTVQQVSSQPVALSLREKSGWGGEDEAVADQDLIGRHVHIAVPEDAAARLRLGERVRCRARIRLGESDRVLPGHLVRRRGATTLVRRATGEEVSVDAIRVGAVWVLPEAPALRPDQLVVPSSAEDPEEQPRAVFAGSVVAVDSAVLRMGDGWGRIDELTPDGSDVEDGEVVVSLRNPYLENREAERRQARVRARQDFLLAVEERRLKAAEADIAHQQHLADYEQAALAVSEAAETDAAAIAAAEQARRQALDERDHRQWLLAQRRQGRYGAAEIRRAERELQQAELAARRAELRLVAARRQRDEIDWRRARVDRRAAERRLALRDDTLTLARREEALARQTSQARLQRSLAGGRWERLFEANRHLQAPAGGRLFYREGWNDHTRSRTKIGKNFSVWWGMPVADIVDMRSLALEAEVPERWYGRLAVGDPVRVVFPQLADRRVAGTIVAIGEHVRTPAGAAAEAAAAVEEVLGLGRVFTIRVRFEPDAFLQNALVPGATGRVELP